MNNQATRRSSADQSIHDFAKPELATNGTGETGDCKRLHCSRAVLGRKLRINERTLEKWEQGRAKPNPQAAALVLLVRKYPDTLERLERVAVG